MVVQIRLSLPFTLYLSFSRLGIYLLQRNWHQIDSRLKSHEYISQGTETPILIDAIIIIFQTELSANVKYIYTEFYSFIQSYGKSHYTTNAKKNYHKRTKKKKRKTNDKWCIRELFFSSFGWVELTIIPQPFALFEYFSDRFYLYVC